jgi:hypothetical protein
MRERTMVRLREELLAMAKRKKKKKKNKKKKKEKKEERKPKGILAMRLVR